MARRIKFQTFDPAQPLVARRKFTANGHRFVPTKPFPWQRMALSLRQVRKLFETGLICHPDSELQSHQEAPEPERAPTSGQGEEDSQNDPQKSEGTGEEDPAKPSHSTEDELDYIDKLADLKDIARDEGAPANCISKAEQREAIRAHRRGEG